MRLGVGRTILDGESGSVEGICLVVETLWLGSVELWLGSVELWLGSVELWVELAELWVGVCWRGDCASCIMRKVWDCLDVIGEIFLGDEITWVVQVGLMVVGEDPIRPSDSWLFELLIGVYCACCNCSLYGYIFSIKITSRLIYSFPLVIDRHR